MASKWLPCRRKCNFFQIRSPTEILLRRLPRILSWLCCKLHSLFTTSNVATVSSLFILIWMDPVVRTWRGFFQWTFLVHRGCMYWMFALRRHLRFWLFLSFDTWYRVPILLFFRFFEHDRSALWDILFSRPVIRNLWKGKLLTNQCRYHKIIRGCISASVCTMASKVYARTSGKDYSFLTCRYFGLQFYAVTNLNFGRAILIWYLQSSDNPSRTAFVITLNGLGLRFSCVM